MGHSWRLVAVIGLFCLVGCGPGEEPAAEAIEGGGEGVTVEAGPAPEGAPAEGDLLDVIPTNE